MQVIKNLPVIKYNSIKEANDIDENYIHDKLLTPLLKQLSKTITNENKHKLNIAIVILAHMHKYVNDRKDSTFNKTLEHHLTGFIKTYHKELAEFLCNAHHEKKPKKIYDAGLDRLFDIKPYEEKKDYFMHEPIIDTKKMQSMSTHLLEMNSKQINEITELSNENQNLISNLTNPVFCTNLLINKLTMISSNQNIKPHNEQNEQDEKHEQAGQTKLQEMACRILAALYCYMLSDDNQERNLLFNELLLLAGMYNPGESYYFRIDSVVAAMNSYGRNNSITKGSGEQEPDIYESGSDTE